MCGVVLLSCVSTGLWPRFLGLLFDRMCFKNGWRSCLFFSGQLFWLCCQFIAKMSYLHLLTSVGYISIRVCLSSSKLSIYCMFSHFIPYAPWPIWFLLPTFSTYTNLSNVVFTHHTCSYDESVQWCLPSSYISVLCMLPPILIIAVCCIFSSRVIHINLASCLHSSHISIWCILPWIWPALLRFWDSR